MIDQEEEKSVEAGKYLSFSLCSSQYAFDINRVVEIFGTCNITRVPKCPNYIKGVINLRVKIIPVVDLRLKFGLAERAYDSRTCIMVVNTQIAENQITIGVIVDTVLEVRKFHSEDIASSPNYGVGLDDSFIIGIGKYDDNPIAILLDIDRIFNGSDAACFIEHTSSEKLTSERS